MNELPQEDSIQYLEKTIRLASAKTPVEILFAVI
jgi:hypothetical protein